MTVVAAEIMTDRRLQGRLRQPSTARPIVSRWNGTNLTEADFETDIRSDVTPLAAAGRGRRRLCRAGRR